MCFLRWLVLPLGYSFVAIPMLPATKLYLTARGILVKTQIVAAVLLIGSSTYALAADAVVEEVVIVDTAYNWSGAYVGAQAGYAWGDSYLDLTEWGPDSGSTLDPDGFFGGLYAGYNHQFSNNVVLGVDADFNLSSIDSSGSVYEEGSFLGDHRATADVKYSGAIRARLGYAVDRWLPYIAGGLSAAKYEFDLGEPGDHVDAEGSKTLTGWNLGAGVEFAATDNIIVRGEYRFSDFGDYDFDSEYDGSIDLATHDIRLGIAYKF